MSKVILKKENIIKNSHNGMRTHFYIKELQDKKLVPLKENHELLPIIARLSGALFSDGNIYFKKSNNYREISFTLGQKEDVFNVTRDIKRLGFKKLHFMERTKQHNIKGRKFIMHTFRVKSCSTALFLFFKSLGIPVGDKRKQRGIIPNWIMDGSTEIKKEFLSAYLGGDGPKLSIIVQKGKNRGPHNQILINDIEFHKKSKFTKEGLFFANQLKDLLEDQGVKVNKIFYEKDNYKTLDNDVPSIIHISISKKIESALSFYNMGYSYCKQKREKSKYAGKFLQILADKRSKWKDKHKYACKLYYKEKKSLKEISKIINIAYPTLFSWLKYKQKPSVYQHGLLYNEWLKEVNDDSTPIR